MNDDLPDQIKRALVDVKSLLDGLGLLVGKGSYQRQAAGFIVRCPWHDDRTPSCSVQLRNGVILANCHGCGQAGDALDLIAAARGLSLTGSDFRQVLAVAADLAGLSVDLDRPEPVFFKKARPAASQEPERPYPSEPEVAELLAPWSCDTYCLNDEVSVYSEESQAWMRSRGLDPFAVEGSETIAQLRSSAKLPVWASYQGQTWWETGHRLIVPMYDASGMVRSVRAIRTIDGEAPKRLPPAGYRASGLVMACPLALGMLHGTYSPSRVLILEGEPDWLSYASMTGLMPHARIGIVSGSWSRSFAGRIPNGADVYLYTDNDEAGDRYAYQISETIGDRCKLFRKELS